MHSTLGIKIYKIYDMEALAPVWQYNNAYFHFTYMLALCYFLTDQKHTNINWPLCVYLRGNKNDVSDDSLCKALQNMFAQESSWK